LGVLIVLPNRHKIMMKVLAAVVAINLLAVSADGAATRKRSDAVHHSSGRPGDRVAAAAAEETEEYDPYLGIIRNLEGYSVSMSMSPGDETMVSMSMSPGAAPSDETMLSMPMSPSAAPSDEVTKVEAESELDPDKAPYCQEEMDLECYKDGWPQCCYASSEPCPPATGPRRPGCDTVETDYCSTPPEKDCYVQVWCALCSNEGWSECCARFLGTNCGLEKPPSCDSGDSDDLGAKVPDKSSSAARGLSALSAAALISFWGRMLS